MREREKRRRCEAQKGKDEMMTTGWKGRENGSRTRLGLGFWRVAIIRSEEGYEWRVWRRRRDETTRQAGQGRQAKEFKVGGP